MNNTKEQAILMMKPSGRITIVAGYPLEELVKVILESTGLTIVRDIECQLDEKDVRNIYPILNVPDFQYGEEWKQDVIDHLTSRPVRAFLVEGDNAQNKATTIKQHIRTTFTNSSEGYQSKVVNNIAHVADPEDFIPTYKALFQNS